MQATAAVFWRYVVERMAELSDTTDSTETMPIIKRGIHFLKTYYEVRRCEGTASAGVRG